MISPNAAVLERSREPWQVKGEAHPNWNDLTGRIFGRLTALRRDGMNHNRESMWLCQCSCGRQSRVLHGALTRPRHFTKSCGCWQDERRRLPKDITDLRSGWIVAVSNTGRQDRRGSYLWLCRCDCGNTKEVAGSSLTSGVVISCGCARKTTVKVRSQVIRADRHERQNLRRARQLEAEGAFTEAEVRELFFKQRGRCIYCSAKLGDDFHRDHVTSLSKGGSNWISNIQLLCPGCNAKKNNLDPFVFAAKTGRLL